MRRWKLKIEGRKTEGNERKDNKETIMMKRRRRWKLKIEWTREWVNDKRKEKERNKEKKRKVNKETIMKNGERMIKEVKS